MLVPHAENSSSSLPSHLEEQSWLAGQKNPPQLVSILLFSACSRTISDLHHGARNSSHAHLMQRSLPHSSSAITAEHNHLSVQHLLHDGRQREGTSMGPSLWVTAGPSRSFRQIRGLQKLPSLRIKMWCFGVIFEVISSCCLQVWTSPLSKQLKI